MYCRYCGKQISEEAIMCPECGTPTKPLSSTPFVEEKTPEVKTPSNIPWTIIGFLLTAFAFLTGIVFGSVMLASVKGAALLYVIGPASILPALAGISILISTLKNETGVKKILALVGIGLAGVALLFVFIAVCVTVG